MKGYLKVALLVATIGLGWSSVASAEEFTKESYVDSVMAMLRTHASAIENLNTHRIKYSNNLVRHAVALEQTFGLLGPMDWHAAQSATLMTAKDPAREEENQAKFHELQERASVALKGVIVAAHRTLEEGDHETLEMALDRMKESCNNCHTYLPEDVAPDVWGNLERK